MRSDTIEIVEELDQSDQAKVTYFAKLLLKQEKYQALKTEIEQRREEIQQGESISHDEFWDALNV